MNSVAILLFLVASIILFIGYGATQDIFYFVMGCTSLGASTLLAVFDS